MDNNKIVLNKNELAVAIEKILEEQISLMKRINNTSSYKREECVNRIELIDKRNQIDAILNVLGIQSFEYCREDYTEIEIR